MHLKTSLLENSGRHTGRQGKEHDHQDGFLMMGT